MSIDQDAFRLMRRRLSTFSGVHRETFAWYNESEDTYSTMYVDGDVVYTFKYYPERWSVEVIGRKRITKPDFKRDVI